MIEDGRVLRQLDERGLTGWSALESSNFYAKAVSEDRLIASKLVETESGPALEHPRLDFISYPYEWTFSMLKDAALLQLDLLEAALQDGITIKDATPFNIQFSKGRPVFIDVGSFERYKPGEPWLGYRQFTRQFLFPLMLHAWAGVAFQPWLRGNMDGPSAADMKRILSWGRRIRPSVFLHVSLQARMERNLEGAAVRDELGSSGMNAELILANVRKLRTLVAKIEIDDDDHGWITYDACSHVGRDRDSKAEFLRAAIEVNKPSRFLDLGANDAHFSEIAADRGAVAVAVDGDQPVLDAVYRRGSEVNIVVSDLTNLSPSQGWAGQERRDLVGRARPDMVLAYGIIHHLIYTASVPPTAVVDWLASFGCPVVVEFVAPDDEMVQTLIANKHQEELHPNRTKESFLELLEDEFDVLDTLTLGQGTRTLFSLQPSSS